MQWTGKVVMMATMIVKREKAATTTMVEVASFLGW